MTQNTGSIIGGFFGEYRFLSNFWQVSILMDGVKYPSVENAYQAAKCLYAKDRNLFVNISPKDAKRLGRNVPMRPDWDGVKDTIMLQLLHQKFQHSDLKKMLLNTGYAELQERNPWHDTYWGIDQNTGEGGNRLGKLLMTVRKYFRNQQKYGPTHGVRIGITERGDAGINLGWSVENNPKVADCDSIVLVTKNLNDRFIDALLACKKPTILHTTCTGWGGTEMEPNVPNYHLQLSQLKKLIDLGYPAKNVVLRIDPIFPTPAGLNRVEEVLRKFTAMNLGIDRIRVSIVDEYRHVKARYQAKGWPGAYGPNFGPSNDQIKATADMLSQYTQKFLLSQSAQSMTIEACAEPKLAEYSHGHIIQRGCISLEDMRRMGLDDQIVLMGDISVNPQNRTGCQCLACKTELLENRHPCPHNCVYCFWKRPGE